MQNALSLSEKTIEINMIAKDLQRILMKDSNSSKKFGIFKELLFSIKIG